MADSELAPLFEPILRERGLELEHLSVKAAGRRKVVQVVVDGDGPNGRGPLLDDIARAARLLNAAVDERDPSGVSPYTIEVSSRGVNRPLTGPQHWRRNTGRLVKLRTGEHEVTGRIVSSDDEGATLDVKGRERRLSYDTITRALVQVEFNRRPSADEVVPEVADDDELEDDLNDDEDDDDDLDDGDLDDDADLEDDDDADLEDEDDADEDDEHDDAAGTTPQDGASS